MFFKSETDAALFRVFFFFLHVWKGITNCEYVVVRIIAGGLEVQQPTIQYEDRTVTGSSLFTERIYL